MDNNQVKQQMYQMYLSLITRMLVTFLIVGGVLGIAYVLVQKGDDWKDIFNVLLGGILTAFIYAVKYWLERSADYSDSKNVDRVNKANQGTETADISGETPAPSDLIKKVIQSQLEEIKRLQKEKEELQSKLSETSKPEGNVQ